MKRLILTLFLILFLFPIFCFAADVTLEWDASTESIAGYYVYQAVRVDDHTSAWQRITPNLIAETVWVITGLDDNNYAWQVTAVDNQGNESFVSNMVERYDRTPPVAVKNLRKTGG